MTPDAARFTPPQPPGLCRPGPGPRQSRRRAAHHGPDVAIRKQPAQPVPPGLGRCLGLALRTWPRAAPGASCLLRLLAHAGQLGPRSVEVALAALGTSPQLAARLLEHLRAGFQRRPQLVPLA